MNICVTQHYCYKNTHKNQKNIKYQKNYKPSKILKKIRRGTEQRRKPGERFASDQPILQHYGRHLHVQSKIQRDIVKEETS